tara:strand:- start:1933 stop:3240 length:1308 start_codon:yes stop_codon:yes gene_type:complete
MQPFDAAWRLLKMPVVDTDVPGLRMAYDFDDEVSEARQSHPQGIVGNSPLISNTQDEISDMTPNEYFDLLNQFFMQEYGKRLPDKDADYRWANMRMGAETPEEHIGNMVQGIGEGQVMGMPSLYLENDGRGNFSPTGQQEGGHRMEALRQMGHGDTPVPVLQQKRGYNKGEPMDIAMRLLKAREYDVGGRMVPDTQTTLTGQSVADRAADLQRQSVQTKLPGLPLPYGVRPGRALREIHRRERESRVPKQNTGLDYHVTVPKKDLENTHSMRRYAIRRGDTDEIVGSLPMHPTYLNRVANTLSGNYKPSFSRIDSEHQGQNLYARALMGLLSARNLGVGIESTERNAMSEGAHRSLMDMYSRAGGNLESLTGYEPASESDAVRYNQIFDDGYGSLRTFDPGGLPVRVIDLPNRRSGPDLAQTDLYDFGLEYPQGF